MKPEERAEQSRSEGRWLWACLTAATVLILAAVAFYWSDHTHFQRKADAMEWRWSNEQATIDYCVKNNLHGYTARAEGVEHDWFFLREISILDGTEVVYTIRGHTGTVFVQIGDVLYVTDSEPLGTECKLRAYDLKARKDLWVSSLRGNPRPATAVPEPWGLPRIYIHTVNIEVDRGAILIFGYDQNGRFIEYVDPRSGKTVGHKTLPRE